MLSLLVLVICGIGIAFFSTQNTQTVDVLFGEYMIAKVPVYMVVLVTFCLGVLVSYILSTMNTLSASMKLHGKDAKIKEDKREIADLTRRLHKLELENERLQTTDQVIDESL